MALAKTGHDAEMHKAKDETYNALIGCCQYDRAPVKKEVHSGPNNYKALMKEVVSAFFIEVLFSLSKFQLALINFNNLRTSISVVLDKRSKSKLNQD